MANYLDAAGLETLWGLVIRENDALRSKMLEIQVGSYIGTGGNGAGNKNKITLTKENPRFIAISGKDNITVCAFTGDGNHSSVPASAASRELFFELSGLSLMWYHPYNAQSQLNTSGVTYKYCIIY